MDRLTERISELKLEYSEADRLNLRSKAERLLEDINYLEMLADLKENAIPLDKVKQAKAEIRKLDDINPDYPMDRTIHVSRNEILEILDKLIAEIEGK